MTPRLRYVTKRFNELLQQNALNVLSYSALHAAMKALQNVAAVGVAILAKSWTLQMADQKNNMIPLLFCYFNGKMQRTITDQDIKRKCTECNRTKI